MTIEVSENGDRVELSGTARFVVVRIFNRRGTCVKWLELSPMEAATLSDRLQALARDVSSVSRTPRFINDNAGEVRDNGAMNP